MTAVFVIGKNGELLMPTTRFGKVRHMLADGRAVICRRNPFTIRLTEETTVYTQPMEVCVDTGYIHIGVSVKSIAREYISAQFDLLPDEKERRDNKRKYRRARRNRLRHREPRFDNRRVPDGWLAPSIRNKINRHVDIIRSIVEVAPITSITLEVAEFDTQLLQALEEGKPVPEGVDYQHGPLYKEKTLRNAAFARDKHTCIFCGKNSFKDNVILRTHHIYFWRGQHGDRLSELATICTKCHTPKNHKKGQLLYGYDKKLPRYTGAAFMNAMRWRVYEAVKGLKVETHMTYGAATKARRNILGIDKSHANDAYAMGKYHPEVKAATETFQKVRRNNRILEKFYDAVYIDITDSKKKKAAELGCERTRRSEPRNGKNSLRKNRGMKISDGRRAIRKQRYSIRPGEIVIFNQKKYQVGGVQGKGKYLNLKDGSKKGLSAAVSAVKCTHHLSG